MAGRRILFAIYDGVKEIPVFHSVMKDLSNFRSELRFHALAFGHTQLSQQMNGLTAVTNIETVERTWPLKLNNLGLVREILLYDFSRQIKDALDWLRPDVVVFADDTPYEAQILRYEAHKRSVPTLLVQESLQPRSETDPRFSFNGHAKLSQTFLRRMLRMPVEFTKEYGCSGCDRICVMGEFSKRRLLRRDVPADAIVMTGQPRYDAICSRLQTNGQEVDRRETGAILFASQPVPQQGKFADLYEDQLLEAVIRAVQRFDSKRPLFVKLHASETEDRYSHILKKLKHPRIHVDRKTDVFELLQKSALAISVPSSFTLEAILTQTLAITLNFTGEPDTLPFAEKGAAVGVHKPDKLQRAMRDLLSNRLLQQRIYSGQKDILHELLFRRDGKASQRIAQAIIELMD